MIVAGCVSSPRPIDNMEPVQVRITPYPYNSDYRGDDLPVEIGRFDVPADYNQRQSKTIELGFVRYPATVENSSKEPIVILAENDFSSMPEQVLIKDMRDFGDVIVLSMRGFGFSSPPPPCASQFVYPLNEPLRRRKLFDAMQDYGRTCRGELARKQLPQLTYTVQHVARDLDELRRALTVERFQTVIIATTSSAIALNVNPAIAEQLIALNPALPSQVNRDYLYSLMLRPQRTTCSSCTSPVDRYKSLHERLSLQAASIAVTGRSGHSVTVTIGPLDLAFVAKESLMAGQDALSALDTAIANALEDDYQPLGALTLAMRQSLGGTYTTALLASAKLQQYRHTPAVDNLVYAVRWPDIAFANPERKSQDTPSSTHADSIRRTLIAISLGNPLTSPAAAATFASQFQRGQVVAIPSNENHNSELDQALSDRLLPFIANSSGQ